MRKSLLPSSLIVEEFSFSAWARFYLCRSSDLWPLIFFPLWSKTECEMPSNIWKPLFCGSPLVFSRLNIPCLFSLSSENSLQIPDHLSFKVHPKMCYPFICVTSICCMLSVGKTLRVHMSEQGWVKWDCFFQLIWMLCFYWCNQRLHELSLQSCQAIGLFLAVIN